MKTSNVYLLIFLILLSGCAGTLSGNGEQRANRSPVVSDFPETFDTEPVIVVPDEPSSVEQIAAKRFVAIISADTGTTPPVVTNSELTDARRDGALVVIGKPAISRFAREASVSADFSTLGDRKGRVVITENPWDRSRPLLLVGGADAFGLWASVDDVHGTDDSTANITTTFEAVSPEELDRLKSADPIGGQLLMQVRVKHRYVTGESSAVTGTYLEETQEYRLLFQRVTVYTTSRFTDSELTSFRTQGIQISQENWISSGDGGSYTATVPVDELVRLAAHPTVTRIETRENVYSTTTTT